ncbi:MAG: ABC transporter permease subunit, partial [Wenzhouxiangellaceae bacterium]
AYRAIESGAIDVIDVYTTDAEIAYYDLKVLEDDRGHFPKYEAVWLYRLDLPNDARNALNGLAGSLNAETMRRLNSAVKIEGRDDTAVAAEWLDIDHQQTSTPLIQALARTTLEHLAIVLVSLSGAILVAIPLGILAARLRTLGQMVLGFTGILQTVPSLAMFVFMIPLFGIGWAAAVAALFVYSLLPIVRNTHAGLTGIDPALRESALVLGLTGRDRLLRIELPLAAGSILAGIKTAAVINVGTTTLAALIGAGGYGQPILTGIRLDDMGLIMQGAIPAALLALLIQWGFDGLERLFTPRGLRN